MQLSQAVKQVEILYGLTFSLKGDSSAVRDAAQQCRHDIDNAYRRGDRLTAFDYYQLVVLLGQYRATLSRYIESCGVVPLAEPSEVGSQWEPETRLTGEALTTAWEQAARAARKARGRLEIQEEI